MPAGLFGHRLLFLALFMASVMTWVFLWLTGYIQHQVMTRARHGEPDVVAVTGLLLVLACALLEFLRFVERDASLLALASIGLCVPWGLVLVTKCQGLARHRRPPTHHE
ncbi:hypothetical protein [Pseudomonas entomophila]|uniref:hypothetical protein n=1 Tax=Pseudomonas entomophila TaxID=312306 RepID=UPI00200C3751|nr:hypothetical protein [Pseudomonas entomophila]